MHYRVKVSLLALSCFNLLAAEEQDTVRVVSLDEVVATGTRVSSESRLPPAF